VKEIRWHARAGQGAKTAAQILAVALLDAGRSVQAFPEYGPERRGAPMRAYNRFDDRPVRRHDSVTEPDVVVVLEPSLLRDAGVTAGLAPDGLMLANTTASPDEIRARLGFSGTVACIPVAPGSRFVNLTMLGALAAALGEPPLGKLTEAAKHALGRKVDPDAIRTAVAAGYDAVEEEAA
jgi:pyruvate ferredoxin oxidoreductase gamma subunit